MVAYQVASGLDITESNAAAIALRESEARFRAVAETAPMPIIAIELEGPSILYSNPEADRVFSLPGDTLTGKSPQILWVKQSDREKLLEHLAEHEALRGYEILLKTARGKEIWLSISAEKLTYDGQPAVLAGMADISERKRLERLKDEFVSTLSHELRTPLTSIMGSLGILTGMYAQHLSEDVMELLLISQRNSDHLVRLINDLLDIQKIEAEKLELYPEPIELSKLLTHAVEINHGYAQQYKVPLKVKDGTPSLSVMADWDRLTQVLSNLISNAIKFSKQGEPVWVGLEDLGGRRARVTVTDTGAGIPDEFRGRIFQKFAQADGTDTRAIGGTGLGLSISKAIVEAHGGSINFDSALGRGTSFFFELDLLAEEAQNAS